MILLLLLFLFFDRKAPEFQCHIKYKNDLPLPPISPVLFDSTLTLPQDNLINLLKSEAVAYSPTSLEKGTRHFTLPADFLKYSVYNMVDLDKFSDIILRGAKGDAGDKEILMTIEELERGNFESERSERDDVIATSTTTNATANATSATTSTTTTTTTNSVKVSSTPQKYSRPEVTWLRRTEYISSVKNNPNNSQTLTTSTTTDDAKAILSEPVKFEEIVKQVEATFGKGGVDYHNHPLKPKLELVQSYPIFFDDNDANSSSYAHCLFLGDSSVTDQSILRVNQSNPIVTLFNPTPSTDTLKSHGQFDIQKSESSKSFVLLLPVAEDLDSSQSAARLAKIGSTFSLRKRRRSSSSRSSKLKKNSDAILMKVSRKQT